MASRMTRETENDIFELWNGQLSSSTMNTLVLLITAKHLIRLNTDRWRIFYNHLLLIRQT